MKNYFILFLILLPLKSFSQHTSIKDMGENLPQMVKRTGALDPGLFYLISNGMIIYNFEQLNDPEGDKFYKYRRDWLHKEASLWKTVNIKELEPLGLKEGSIFRYIEWGQNSVKEYKLKKDVHIALIKNEQYEAFPKTLFARTFYIVLNDSVEGLKHPGAENADTVTGIAYIGSEFELMPSGETNGREFLFPKIDIQKQKELAEYYINRSKKPPTLDDIQITDLSFDSYNLYFLEKKSTSDKREEVESKMIILKTSDNSFKELPVLSTFSSIFEIRFSNFIKGSDLTILKGKDIMHSCYELIIFKENKEKKFQLMCDSGGC